MLNLREHISREHRNRRIHCGCGQSFKWRSAFARHKDKCSESHNCKTDPSPFQRSPKKTTRKTQQQETRERLQNLIASQGPMTVSSVIKTKLSPEKGHQTPGMTSKCDGAKQGLETLSSELEQVFGKSQNIKESSENLSRPIGESLPEVEPNVPTKSVQSITIKSRSESIE